MEMNDWGELWMIGGGPLVGLSLFNNLEDCVCVWMFQIIVIAVFIAHGASVITFFVSLPINKPIFKTIWPKTKNFINYHMMSLVTERR
jgi:hypothetical protein